MIMTTILIKCPMHTHLKVFKWILCQVFACQCLVAHEKELDCIVKYRILVANVAATFLYRKVTYYPLQRVIHHTAMKHSRTQKAKQAKAINNDKVTPLDSQCPADSSAAQSGRCQRNKQNQRYCVIAEAVDSWCNNVFLFNCLRHRHSCRRRISLN